MNLDSSHAHIVYGDSEAFFKQVTAWIDTHHGPQEDGVTFFSYNKRVLKIGDVRDIQHPVNLRGAEGKAKHVIIRAQLIVLAAQNALLKTLEDPQSDTRFYINVPSGSYIIPTILSRTAQHTIEGGNKDVGVAKEFISSHYAGRSALLEQYKFENEQGKMVYDKEQISVFVSQLIAYMLQLAHAKQTITADEIASVRKLQTYILDPSSSTKQIVESIAVLVPVIK